MELLRVKIKIADYNHVHDIMRTFDVLPNLPGRTSKMKPDY